MADAPKNDAAKSLAEMTSAEITALAERELATHRERQKYLKALAKVTPNK